MFAAPTYGALLQWRLGTGVHSLSSAAGSDKSGPDLGAPARILDHQRQPFGGLARQRVVCPLFVPAGRASGMLLVYGGPRGPPAALPACPPPIFLVLHPRSTRVVARSHCPDIVVG